MKKNLHPRIFSKLAVAPTSEERTVEKPADVKHFDSKIREVINSCRYPENPVSKKKQKEGMK